MCFWEDLGVGSNRARAARRHRHVDIDQGSTRGSRPAESVADNTCLKMGLQGWAPSVNSSLTQSDSNNHETHCLQRIDGFGHPLCTASMVYCSQCQELDVHHDRAFGPQWRQKHSSTDWHGNYIDCVTEWFQFRPSSTTVHIKVPGGSIRSKRWRIRNRKRRQRVPYKGLKRARDL